MPTRGDIGGAEISFSPGDHIPDKVLFDTEGTNYTMSGGNFSIETNAKGIVNLKVIGAGQKHRIPDSAKPYEPVFTIRVSAQPAGQTAKSLINMFMDSLTFWRNPGGAKAVAPFLGLLKTLHYDLGERGFVVRDWAKPAYEFKAKEIGVKFKPQTFCDFNSLSAVQENDTKGATTFTWNYQFTPAGSDGLSGEVGLNILVDLFASDQHNIFKLSGSGPYNITPYPCSNGQACQYDLLIPNIKMKSIDPFGKVTYETTNYHLLLEDTIDPNCP